MPRPTRRTSVPALVAVALSFGAVQTLDVTSATAAAARPAVRGVSANAGKVTGGERVTVSGTGFSKVSAVVFGRTKGTSVRVASSSRLTVVTPRHAVGRVDVRVVAKAGTSAVATGDRFTYVAPPTVTGVTGFRTSAELPGLGVGGGQRVTVSGTNLRGVRAVRFGTSAGTAVKVAASRRSLSVVTPAHAAGNVHVQVVTAFGTSAARRADVAAYVATSVGSVGPGNAPVAGGGEIYLDGQALDRATRVTFGGTAGTIVKREGTYSGSLLRVRPPAHAAGPVTVTVTGPDGTASAPLPFAYRPVAQPGWTARPQPLSASGLPDALSCVTSDFCASVDQTGAVQLRRDGTWSESQRLGDATGARGVSCASDTFCVAATDTSLYRFDGTDWESMAAPGDGYNSIACTSPVFCVTAAEDGAVLTWDGASWSAPKVVAAGARVDLVSCGSAGSCLATGEHQGAYRLASGAWTTVSKVPVTTVYTLSCTGSSACFVGDDTGRVTTFDGTRWSKPVAAGKLTAVHTIACLSPTSCVAMDFEGAVATLTGSTWKVAPALQLQDLLGGLACLSDGSCVATDTAGYGYDRSPAGTWSDGTFFDRTHSLGAVTCLDATFCVGVDYSGEVRTFDGSAWSAPTATEAFYPRTVTCFTRTSCLLIDYNGDVFRYDGDQWSYQESSGTTYVDQLSCAGLTRCVVIGDDVGTWNGSSWSRVTLPGRGADERPRSASCPSTTFCLVLAVGDSGSYAYTFDGSRWTRSTIGRDALDNLSSVSCASSTFCAAAGNGAVTTFDGTRWSTAQSLSLGSLACPVARRCYALDGPGVSTYDGSSWTQPTDSGLVADGLDVQVGATGGFAWAFDRYGRFVTRTED